MNNDIVHGLLHFSEYFKGFEKDYIIIGGMATAINQRRFGFAARATLDIDLIVLDEADGSKFIDRFVQYIKEVGYLYKQKHFDDIKILAGFVEEEQVEVSENILKNIYIVANELKKVRGKEELAENLLKVFVKK